MYLSIIIPTFNGAKVLAAQLEALANQISPGPFEVIISDNGSTDRTGEVVAHYVGQVSGLRMVDSSDRRGRSHARNVGAQAATAEALAFTDQDDVVGEGWVRAMGMALETHDFVTGPIESKRLNESWRIEHTPYPLNEPYVHQHPPHLAHAPGNNLGVKRALHRTMGGFDEALMSAWEDADFAFRIQLAGTRLHFAPGAIVHYRLRHDFGSIFRQARMYGKGNVEFYKKYESLAPLRESWKSKITASTSLFRPRTILGLRKKSKRAVWQNRLGWLIGHLEGCIRNRTLAPLYWT